MKKQSFLQGAFVLICANLLVKVIGAGFKIPLTYLIDEEGMGLFGSAYTVYTILFVIATAGFPIAISKMVSECVALGKYREADRVFNVSLVMLLCVGIFGSAVIYFGAPAFAAFLEVSDTVYVIKAIAPAVFFVSIMSALRGYFQGHQNMYPTAISEVVEALGKLIIGYALAYAFMGSSVAMAATGAILGVTAGTVFGAMVLIVIFVHKRHNRENEISAEKMRSKRSIAKEIVKIAVPITIGASVSSITTLIDAATITKRLQSIAQVTQEFMVRYGGIIEKLDAPFTETGAIGEKLATALYGLYNGYAIPLFNLPLTIVAAIAMSVVPAISAAIATKDKLQSETVTKSALRITVLLAVPCGVGLYVLAHPVLSLLYNNGLAYTLLEKLGPAIVFVSLVSVSGAILQAYGKPALPMINMLVGGIVKIAVNYTLVGTPEYNIDGAPIGTMLCYFVIVVLNIFWVIRVTRYKFKISEFIVKPLLTAGVMGVAVKIFYDLCYKTGFGNTISVVFSIGIGIVIYAILIFVTGTIKREDIKMLPKGDALEKILTKAKLLK